MYPLTAKWTILPGKRTEAIKVLKKLAEQVKENEKETLAYLVNLPNAKAQNTVTPYDGEVTFFEIYKNEQAFMNHLNGSIFKDFVKDHGDLFLRDDKGQPYVIAENLDFEAGFIRENIIK